MLAFGSLIPTIAVPLLLPEQFKDAPTTAIVMTLFAAAAGIAFLMELAGGQIGRARALVELVISAVLLIVYFAAIYRACGLNLPQGESATSFWTGLFSLW
ncbi:MAG: hypothetical protein VYB54_13860 [Pseudomonadota bacterium]|nr:hypothetical protein [Pseudomonadota bacterium]